MGGPCFAWRGCGELIGSRLTWAPCQRRPALTGERKAASGGLWGTEREAASLPLNHLPRPESLISLAAGDLGHFCHILSTRGGQARKHLLDHKAG